MRRKFARLAVFGILAMGAAPQAAGYSVLTHEAVIDAAWKDNIKPLLLKRFPGTSEEDLLAARAYSYGGAIIQDMGYYPFGSKFFSDLAHYVRSGDFVVNLLSEAQTLNEYAFALGAVAHYAGDNNGHRLAVNRIVPMMFPKLEQKYGQVITYADDKTSHLKVEFSFDVLQVAQGHYAPAAYHDFVGFKVSKECLERAFAKTYGLEMSSIFLSEDMALGTYRYAVSQVLPMMTAAAWKLKKKEILTDQPTATRKNFIYNISRSDYRKEWGTAYKGPGPVATIIAFIFRIVPKFGPFKALAFQPPPAAAETMFLASFNATLDKYKQLLAAQGAGALKLPDENFDTGQLTSPGAYRLADDAYAKLLDRLKGKPVPADLRANILAFYADRNVKIATRRDDAAWKKLLEELDQLKGQTAVGN
jgi:Zinc dependent phospholipase C